MALPVRRRHVVRTIAAATIALLAAVTVPPGPAPATPPPPSSTPLARPAQRVILFDFDGFDPRFVSGRYAGVAELPNLRALIEEGSYGVARGSFSSYSNSSRATTATGTYPITHRNTGYYYSRDTDRGVSQERYLEPGVETIAQSLRRQDRTAAYLQWYVVQNYGAAFGDPAALYTQPGGDCQTRADQAIALLHGEPVDSGGTMVDPARIPDLITVYCDDVDAVLHSDGFSAAGLPAALARVDAQIGRVRDAAREAGILDETAFVVTADHGARDWTIPLLPEVVDRLAGTGLTVEVISSSGGAPDPASEIVIVAAPRTADITLRGRADTPAQARNIARIIRSVPGIAAVYDERDLRRMKASDKLGDLVVEPIEPYHLSTLTDGKPRGSHGGLAEAYVPLVLSGAGIRAGVPLHDVGLVDVAATIGALLGVHPPSTSRGQAVRQAIERP
ncbi:alkaline phosphatase family protein [Micromonospora sp. WMMD1102]|uniref:alkaline phosphatase family protein n=1 Tax=Micromonospora sp. WMMD1102 TaxID=3016105 RepID=UPI00241567D1|nr:alkaline phosphatase family protein [Micromonospora sp. WMMD1102]MDG4785741.1 alkaline phosphatase family protein [Micromonospora sp. WMMD1102]